MGRSGSRICSPPVPPDWSVCSSVTPRDASRAPCRRTPPRGTVLPSDRLLSQPILQTDDVRPETESRGGSRNGGSPMTVTPDRAFGNRGTLWSGMPALYENYFGSYESIHNV